MSTKVLGLFDRLYVINLKDRRDRYVEMSRELAKIGLSWESPNVEVYHAARPAGALDFPSQGARGCFISHHDVVALATRRDEDATLIMEDDIDLPPDAEAKFRQALATLESDDWDFLYFDYHTPDPPEAVEPGMYRFDGDLMFTSCYALSRRGRDAVLDHLDASLRRPVGHELGGPTHVDGSYSLLREHNPHIVTYIAHPRFLRQRSSRSDVTRGRFDSIPIVGRGVNVLRQIRNRLR